MKYIIVYLSLVILIFYAVLDNRLDAINRLHAESTSMKNSLSNQYLTINKLEDYRKGLKPPVGVLPLGWPIELSEYKYISSYYGRRNDPLRRNTGGTNDPFHNGVDMAGNEEITGVEGARVLSVAPGIVTVKFYEKGWHNGIYYSGHPYFNGYIEILHDNGMTSKSGHVGEILVHEGERVEGGQHIARISQQVDKYSTGRHLDFRLEINGKYVNPLLWIGRGE